MRVMVEELLELIGGVAGLLDVDEFRAGLLAALLLAVPADWISLNDVGPDPARTVVLVEPPLEAHAHRVFAAHAHENPLLQRYQQTLDGRAYRFSDVTTPAALRRTALHREFYGPIGLEHQIAFVLEHGPDRVLAVALSRRYRDFTDAERALLDRARPFLIQAYRTAVEHTRLRALAELREAPVAIDLGRLAAEGLTEREREVLGLVAWGRTNAEIAAVLGLSVRTVQKHLERVYRKLGVRSRSQAAAAARAAGAD